MSKIEKQRASFPPSKTRGLGPSTVDTTGFMPNEVWTVRAGSAAIIIVRGELDVASAVETLDAVMRAISKTSHDRILIDLADVTFMDAAGLGAVISARALANGVRIPLDLLTPSEAVCRLLRRTHMDQNFRMYDSLDAAIDDLRETLSGAALSAPANPRSRGGRSDQVGRHGQQADRGGRGCTPHRSEAIA